MSMRSALDKWSGKVSVSMMFDSGTAVIDGIDTSQMSNKPDDIELGQLRSHDEINDFHRCHNPKCEYGYFISSTGRAPLIKCPTCGFIQDRVAKSQMSAVKPEYHQYIDMFNKLVKDYALEGDAAIDKFVVAIQSRPYDDFIEFTKANNLAISLLVESPTTGKREPLPNPELYLKNELRKYIIQSLGTEPVIGVAKPHSWVVPNPPPTEYMPGTPGYYRDEWVALIDAYHHIGEPAVDNFINYFSHLVHSQLVDFISTNMLPIHAPEENMLNNPDIERRNRARTYFKTQLTDEITKSMHPSTAGMELPSLVAPGRETSRPPEKEIIEPLIAPPWNLGPKSPACDAIPEHTTSQMIVLSEKAILDGGEFGGALNDDKQLTNIVEGNAVSVGIPRSKDTIGTFHAHIQGGTTPSPGDLQDMLMHYDNVMCIGRTTQPIKQSGGKIIPGTTKIQCFSQNNPKFTNLKQQFDVLVKDTAEFRKLAKAAYKTRGKKLRAILREFSSPEYLSLQPIHHDPEKQRQAELAADAAEGESEALRDKYESLAPEAERLDRLWRMGQEEFNTRKFTSQEEIRFAGQDLEPVGIKAVLASNELDDIYHKLQAADANALKLRTLAISLQPDRAMVHNEAVRLAHEAALLTRRAAEFNDELYRQTRLLAGQAQWRPGEKAPEGGFNPEELALLSCHLIWEEMYEERPWEWEYATPEPQPSGRSSKIISRED